MVRCLMARPCPASALPCARRIARASRFVGYVLQGISSKLLPMKSQKDANQSLLSNRIWRRTFGIPTKTHSCFQPRCVNPGMCPPLSRHAFRCAKIPQASCARHGCQAAQAGKLYATSSNTSHLWISVLGTCHALNHCLPN